MPKCAPIKANAVRNNKRADALVAQQNAIAVRQNKKVEECKRKDADVASMDKSLEMWKKKSMAEKSTLLNKQKYDRTMLRNKHASQYAAWKKQRAAMVKDKKSCEKDLAKINKQWMKKKSQAEAAEARMDKYVNAHKECKSLPRKKRSMKPAKAYSGKAASKAPKAPKEVLSA